MGVYRQFHLYSSLPVILVAKRHLYTCFLVILMIKLHPYSSLLVILELLQNIHIKVKRTKSSVANRHLFRVLLYEQKTERILVCLYSEITMIVLFCENTTYTEKLSIREPGSLSMQTR